jgi:type II restriction enzyme
VKVDLGVKGAIAGFLFDLGAGRYVMPPSIDDSAEISAWQADLNKVRAESAAASKAAQANEENELKHSQIQGWLRDLGHALDYDVWIAANDRRCGYNGGELGIGCLAHCPWRYSTGHLLVQKRVDLVRAFGSAYAAQPEHTCCRRKFPGCARL